MRKRRGFTLMEIVLVVGVMATIFAFSLPVYESLKTKNDLNITVNTVAQALRRAQSISRSGYADLKGGVQVQTGQLTIFLGDSYSSRSTEYDEDYILAGNVTISGLSEISFDKLTGNPSSTGTITFTGAHDETKTITINAQGMVNY